MTIDEYAKAVAEAVRAHCEQEARDWDDRAGQAIGNVIAGIRLDAIIASVPKPEAQHHDAPTCDGWWWARLGPRAWNGRCPQERWHAVRVEPNVRDVFVTGDNRLWRTADFDQWLSLLPPDGGES